jgi:phosphopantetheine--protein transferase-like protein
MLARPEFHKIVANILRRSAADITPATPLSLNSFDRAKLSAAVSRHFGKKPSEIVHARTIGELEAILFTVADDGFGAKALNTEEPLSLIQSPGPSLPTFGKIVSADFQNVLCGIDLEPVVSMPEARDFWEDDFYKTVFTPAEIAYCTTQAEPRMHFAARWCAKEALRKCDPHFAKADYTELELIRTETGGLTLRHLLGGAATILPHAVSVTHTPQVAAAVVVLTLPDSANPPSVPCCVECAKTADELRQSRVRLLKTIGDSGQEVWMCTTCLTSVGGPTLMGFE